MTEKKVSVQASILWNSAGSMVYLITQWLITVLVVRMAGVSVAGDFTKYPSLTCKEVSTMDIFEMNSCVLFSWCQGDKN